MSESASMRVVVAEPFAEDGLEVLRSAGIDVISCVGAQRPRLLEAVRDAQGLIVRSETRVDRELLSGSRDLRVVGRAGVGVDTIDVDAATRAGIVVVNTPSANTIAATEQTFALLLSLLRHVPMAATSVKAGRWERAGFVGGELHGKTLGILGLGRIGSAVATRAQAFGMRTIAFDPYIAAEPAEGAGIEILGLDDVLASADVVSLHVPLNDQTIGLLGARELGLMKQGAILVNCARGGLVDEAALLSALDSGHLSAAAIDVVAQEPPEEGSAGEQLHQHPKVLATPHLGGSTREALGRIATELAADIVSVLAGRPAGGAVNAPTARGADAAKLRPYIDLAYRIGLMLPQLGDSTHLGRPAMSMCGDIAQLESAPLVSAFLSGILQRTTARRVSIVNAGEIAKERGIEVAVRFAPPESPWLGSLRVHAGPHHIVGTALDRGSRIVEIDGFEIDADPRGTLILTRHQDVPGMIGRAGTLLGDARVNISTMQVARNARGGEAMMVLSVDRMPDASTLRALQGMPFMNSACTINL